MRQRRERIMKVPKQYLAAFKCGHRENAKDSINDDFSKNLLNIIKTSNNPNEVKEAEKALLFYTQFNKEWERGSISKKDSEERKQDFHSTDDERRIIYARNNARNKEVKFNQVKEDKLKKLIDSTKYPESIEESLIEYIDNKTSKKTR